MKKLFSLFAAVLFAVLMFAENGSWTYKFVDTKVAVSATDSTYTVNGVTWKIGLGEEVGEVALPTSTSKSTLSGVDYYVLKFGSSGSKYYETVSISTDAFADKIVDSVAVNIRNNGSKKGTLTVKQGGVVIGTHTQAVNSSDWEVRGVKCTGAEGGKLELSYVVAQCSHWQEVTVFYHDMPAAPTTGWDGTAVFSMANMSSVADLEGITLTLNGATLALLDEDDFGGIYLQDEQGSNIYAICHPALGGNFAINGDVVTLTGWSTTDVYCVALPTESATLYFSDYGCFEIDGEAAYFADDDVAINYVAAAATTYTVTYSVSGIVADETAAQAGYYNQEAEGAEFVAGANVVPENMIAYVYAQMIEGYTCEVLVNGAAVTLTDGYWEAAITADMTIAVAFSEEQGEVSPYASVYTSNVEFTAGTNSYLTDKINIDGTEYDAFKIGTSKAAGSCSVTLPAGTEEFYFHAICWSKTADTDLNITGAYTETVVIKAANISGTSPYTFDLTYADPTQRFYSHTFDAPLAAEATVTFSCAYRAVFFGVNAVGAVVPTSLDNLDAVQAVKFVENGQVIILRDGVRYNALGQVIE